ncbi:MAG: DUF6691 family protein [Longimicrobiales bacterium]
MTPVPNEAATTAPKEVGVAATAAATAGPRWLVAYALVGVILGIVMIKAEIVSWFRIQEMFRFQAFHMYGIILTASIVALASVTLLKRSGARSLTGEAVRMPPKAMGKGTRYWGGGLIFGFGWALTGACPGPMYALIGSGAAVFLLVLASAVAGMWLYGHARPHLPH